MIKNEANILSNIEVETGSPVNKSLIWMHGLGADGHDFVPFVSELHLPKNLKMRFIFPHAPTIPVTINNGYLMRAWYDIYELAIDNKVDKAGINKSVISIQQLIEREVERGVRKENIILGGFSQGAAMALTTGLLYPEKLGGIIAISGYLPALPEVLANASQANHDTPIFIAHGTEDPIVFYSLGKSVYVQLNQTHKNITWRSYPIGHSVCSAEIDDISQWLQSLIKNKT